MTFWLHRMHFYGGKAFIKFLLFVNDIVSHGNYLYLLTRDRPDRPFSVDGYRIRI